MGKFVFVEHMPDDVKLIEGSCGYYINRHGIVYKKLYGKWMIKQPNIKCGYYYHSIKMEDGKFLNKRTHRLVAEAFIPNPDNLPIVMHKDNDKLNPSVKNLEWGTISENTKKAFDGGLAINAKGIEDSQSIQVDCYLASDKSYIKTFGSISEASRETGLTKQTIIHQCRSQCKPRKHAIYFRYKNNGQTINERIG